MQPTAAYSKSTAQVQVNSFVRSVYNWMAIGLALTGFIAFYVASNETLINLIYGNRLIFYGMVIGEFALVFILAGRIQKMSASTATGMFLFYAALNGATFSYIFLLYTSASIASTFFICAGTFLACSIYGYTTKRDLTSIGNFLIMGLFGLIIASFVNLLIGSSAMQMIISYIGVVVFIGLTAYDTQKIKAMAVSQPADLSAGVVRKGAIIGALSLYLDFILLFQSLLHIFGGSRD